MTARHPRCLRRPRRRSAQGVYYVNRIAAMNLNFLLDFWEIDLAKQKGAVGPTCVLYIPWFKVRFVRTDTNMDCRYIIKVPSLL